MPEALIGAGLEARLRESASVSTRTVDFVDPVPTRGESGLLAEDALVSMTSNLASVVADTHGGNPIVIGGDCSVLIGALAGIRSRRRDLGLLFVDGHEDAWPPASSTTGEMADCELGIALGIHRAPSGLVDLTPLVDLESVSVVGPRDIEELRAAGIESIRRVVRTVPWPELAAHDMSAVGREAVDLLSHHVDEWWLHIDLDVLSTAELPAVDYPQPGGLTWEELEALTCAALAAGGCLGISVVIYNPDLDAGEHAPRIVDFVGRLLTAHDPGLSV
jgi:arginase